MKLLEKTRKINKLLQKGDKVEFNAIAKLLRDVIEANTYIVGRKGGVKGYALIHEFECDIMREQVLDDIAEAEDANQLSSSKVLWVPKFSIITTKTNNTIIAPA